MNLKENMRQVKSFVLGSVFLLVFASSSMGETLDFLVRGNDIVRGDPRAPVTLLEYSDFTCGFCEKFFHETFPLLLSNYVETGKVRFVYRDFLRSPVGPALKAAQATRCAAEQEAYWPMHDRLFNSGMQFNVESLGNYAKELGLDASQFATCIEENRHVAAIYKDRLEAGSLGIRGTPGFVLFLTELPEDRKVVMIPGALPFEVFKEQIDQLLESIPANNPSKGTEPNSIPKVQGL